MVINMSDIQLFQILKQKIGEAEAEALSGVLPTLADLARAGFDKSKVDDAIHDKIIVEFYVTLTNGTILKGYKIHVE